MQHPQPAGPPAQPHPPQPPQAQPQYHTHVPKYPHPPKPHPRATLVASSLFNLPAAGLCPPGSPPTVRTTCMPGRTKHTSASTLRYTHMHGDVAWTNDRSVPRLPNRAVFGNEVLVEGAYGYGDGCDNGGANGGGAGRNREGGDYRGVTGGVIGGGRGQEGEQAGLGLVVVGQRTGSKERGAGEVGGDLEKLGEVEGGWRAVSGVGQGVHPSEMGFGGEGRSSLERNRSQGRVGSAVQGKRKVQEIRESRFREGLDVLDKFGFVQRDVPVDRGEPVQNKIQRYLNKIERDYIAPDKSYWKRDQIDPIPELIIKPITNKPQAWMQDSLVASEVINADGMEKYKLDIRDPDLVRPRIAMPLHERSIPGKWGDFGPILNRSSSANRNSLGAKKEIFMKQRVEAIRKKDYEEMLLRKEIHPKYEKELAALAENMSQEAKLARKLKQKQAETRKPPPQLNRPPKPLPKQEVVIQPTPFMRDLAREVLIPDFKQSPHLRAAIENANRPLPKRTASGKKPPQKASNPSETAPNTAPAAQNPEPLFSLETADTGTQSAPKPSTHATQAADLKELGTSQAADTQLSELRERRVFRDDSLESVRSSDQSNEASFLSRITAVALEGEKVEREDSFEEVEDFEEEQQRPEIAVEYGQEVGMQSAPVPKKPSPEEIKGQVAAKVQEELKVMEVAARAKIAKNDTKESRLKKKFARAVELANMPLEIEELEEQIRRNTVRLNKLHLEDLLTRKKALTKGDKHLEEKRKAEIIRNCKTIEKMIELNRSQEEIELAISGYRIEHH